MSVRRLLSGSLVGVFLLAANPAATGQPARKRCTVSFALSEVQGAMASADLENGGLERLYVEMGPARAALITEGPGISGAYKVQTPELIYWHYMSIYETAKAWLTPGSVKLFYSGFRVGWPELRLGGKIVNKLKLTVTHGDQSMTIDVDPDAEGTVVNSRVIAIDLEEMLVGAYPAARVYDHRAWRQAAEQQRAISVTLTDASNGQVMARGEAARLAEDSTQALLSGGLNALREKYNEGRCV